MKNRFNAIQGDSHPRSASFSNLRPKMIQHRFDGIPLDIRFLFEDVIERF